MNKAVKINVEQPPNEQKTRLHFLDGKVKDLMIVGILALVLVFASWKIFYTDEKNGGLVSTATTTQSEERVKRLLEEIDGVGEAEVMVCETEEGVQGVVVVCEGATRFEVVIQIRQAVAAALGTNEKAVKIYQKKG